MKYSISKREKNKIYYTSIKVKKHEEKHSKLGRPKKLQKKLKKKTVTLQNCHASKKNYIKKKPSQINETNSKKKKKRERKLSQKLIKNIHPIPSRYPLSLHPRPSSQKKEPLRTP